MCYILRYDQDRAQVVGPFDYSDEAAAWAEAVCGDDIRWALVANAEVTTVTPHQATRLPNVVIAHQELVLRPTEITSIYFDMLEQGVPVEYVANMITDHCNALADIIARKKLALAPAKEFLEFYTALEDLVEFHNIAIKIYE